MLHACVTESVNRRRYSAQRYFREALVSPSVTDTSPSHLFAKSGQLGDLLVDATTCLYVLTAISDLSR